MLADYWPVSRKGSVLITTRRSYLPLEAIDAHLEVLQLSPFEGRDLFLHLLPEMADSDAESESAIEMSKKLDGHSLAINHMAALVKVRGISLTDLVRLYEKHPKRVHRIKQEEWTVGSIRTVDTVWKVSFASLSPQAFTILSVICCIAPDSIQQTLFEPRDGHLPDICDFCQDELRYSPR